MKRRYTIIAYTENHFGILNRITIVFSRRRINIESLTVSETEKKGISRFTIVIFIEDEKIEKLVKQVRKIIGVLTVFHNEEEEVFFNQIAFIKVSASSLDTREKVMELAHRHSAKVAYSTDHFLVIEKTGKEDEIATTLHLFEPFGVQEFVKSGRIAVVKDQSKLEQYTENIEDLKHSVLKQETYNL